MLFQGITLVEGSERQNLTVDAGATLPSTAIKGQLFYMVNGTSTGLYFYSGSAWILIKDQNNDLKYTPVNKAGDTMSGKLTLAVDPGAPMDAVTKRYVDNYQFTWDNVGMKPTTIAGFGIKDAQPLNGNLTSISAVTGTGFLTRTGLNTYAVRSLTGTASRINVTNADGLNGAPTIDLAPTGLPSGTYVRVTTDEFGRVLNGVNTLPWDSISSTPTTLAGYGIADAQAKSIDLNAIAALSSGYGLLKRNSDGTWALDSTSYALLNSPDFFGVPKAPTAPNGTSTTQIATTAFVMNTASALQSSVQGGSVASANKWTTARTLSLGGDGTMSMVVDGSGDVNATLTFANVNANVGSYGTASSVASFTVNAKGLVTAASNTPIAIATSQVTSGTLADARIAQSNVTQYQAALSIAESQIPDAGILARVASAETVTGAWTFTTPIVGVDPTLATHLVTKQYVDNITTGLDFKASVKAATTANIAALSGEQTIDGVALVAGDRVLVKDQSTASQNGIYVVAVGVWSRSSDADNTPGIEITAGMYCFVEQGTTNADSGWVLTTDGPITLGTTSLAFAQFTGLGQVTAGSGLTKNGSTISVATAAASRIAVSSGGVDLATVSDNGSGAFKKVSVDAYGRVVGTTPVVTSDLSSLLTSTNIAEGTNLYYTDTRARTALSVSGTGLSYNASTGVISSNATNANTASTPVARDASGNFSAGTITATLSGSLTVQQTNEMDLANGFAGGTLWLNYRGTSAAITQVNIANGLSTGALAAINASNISAGGNVTGTATNVTGTVAIANGGTGATTAAQAVKNLGAVAVDGSTEMSGKLAIQKNNAAISSNSYSGGHIELRTVDGSYPVLGFHRAGSSAVALYHDSISSLRLKDVNGGDFQMFHSGNLTNLNQLSNGPGYATAASVPAVNPSTPKDGDVQVAAGPTISIYAAGAWRQIFPAVYS
jgi:hypothetical protein